MIEGQQIYRNEQSYPFPFIEDIFNIKTTGLVTNPVQYSNEVIIGVLKKIYSSNGKLDMLEIGKRMMISLKEQLISYLKLKYTVEVNHVLLSDM